MPAQDLPDRNGAADPADLERQAAAAYLSGRDAESTDLLARAHAAFVDRGDLARGALSAFWIGFILSYRGERAPAGGWLARAKRLAEEAGGRCAAAGYLLLPTALQHVGEGRLDAALARFEEAAAMGRQLRDADLANLALQGCGRTLVGLGRVADGLALLDEAMVAVTAGEVSPIVTGTIYCSVISACFDIFDLRRAQEWTTALDEWCASQPGMVPYRGECLVHRAEIMAMHGSWPDALAEAQRACECLSQPWARSARAAGDYVIGEIHRVRGEFDRADAAYQRVADAGRPPYPGLALLRLAQGRTDVARSAIARFMEGSTDRRTRSRGLPAQVEILLAVRDPAGARAAADELASIARTLDQPWVRATSAYCLGAVSLAEGRADDAMRNLQQARATWGELEAGYEAARTTLLLGLCCRALGDPEAAQAEITAAGRAFRALGASVDLARAEDLLAKGTPRGRDVLTAREKQILKLIASGRTNRAIAAALSISEKTVARHVSNIFTKLDLSSRAAATAYAFKNHLT